jgi:hypothetical protein
MMMRHPSETAICVRAALRSAGLAAAASTIVGRWLGMGPTLAP